MPLFLSSLQKTLLFFICPAENFVFLSLPLLGNNYHLFLPLHKTLSFLLYYCHILQKILSFYSYLYRRKTLSFNSYFSCRKLCPLFPASPAENIIIFSTSATKNGPSIPDSHTKHCILMLTNPEKSISLAVNTPLSQKTLSSLSCLSCKKLLHSFPASPVENTFL